MYVTCFSFSWSLLEKINKDTRRQEDSGHLFVLATTVKFEREMNKKEKGMDL